MTPRPALPDPIGPADLAEVVLRLAREISFRPPQQAGAVSLTPAAANVMRYLDHQPGSTPSEVAQAVGLLRSNVSTTLRELEGAGFVERRRDVADGRGVHLFPTAEAAANLAAIRQEWNRRVRDVLGDDPGVAEAVHLLERLVAGLVRARRDQDVRS